MSLMTPGLTGQNQFLHLNLAGLLPGRGKSMDTEQLISHETSPISKHLTRPGIQFVEV